MNRIFGTLCFKNKEDLQAVEKFLGSSEYQVNGLSINIDRLDSSFFQRVPDDYAEKIVCWFSDDCHNPTSLWIGKTGFEEEFDNNMSHVGWRDSKEEKFTTENLEALATDFLQRPVKIGHWKHN